MASRFEKKKMKSRFLQSLAYILPFVLKVVAAGVFLCIVGGISLPACIAIVILLALVGSWSRQKTSSNFTLYEVEIVPHIGLMLMMLDLVTGEEWERLSDKRVAPTSWTSLHLENGITAVVLSESVRDGSGRQEVRWIPGNLHTRTESRIPHRLYQTHDGLRYRESLEFLTIQDSDFPKGVLWSPKFYFDSALNGEKLEHEIGIEVRTSWWNENKTRIEQLGIARRVHSQELLDTRIALAVLPSDIFILLNERDWDRDFAKDAREQVYEGLMREKWEINTIGFSDNIDHEFALLRNFGESYICSYAEVSVKPLNV
jgi:hypothetical protein